jgi:membrane protease YdiL (CAAX protease family)
MPSGSRNLVAPLWHTFGLLLLIAVPLAFGVYLQTHGGSASQVFSKNVSFYFSIQALVYEFLLIAYTWWGVRKSGLRLRELIGGRWKNWTAILADAGLGLVFLIAFQVVLQVLVRALGAGHAKSISAILPNTQLEILLWILLSITAGFVEEIVLRGYLQTQLARLGAPAALAILGQALIFSVGHAYEGFHSVIFISVFGILAGLLAAWRRSLRPGIFGHALTDMLVLLQRVR